MLGLPRATIGGVFNYQIGVEQDALLFQVTAHLIKVERWLFFGKSLEVCDASLDINFVKIIDPQLLLPSTDCR
jgi:hypothetical protein